MEARSSPQTAIPTTQSCRPARAQSLVGVLIPNLAEALERLRLVLELDGQATPLGIWVVRCEGLLEVGILERVFHRAAREVSVAVW